MSLKLLEKLALTPGVPGREHRVRELILSEIEGLFDQVETDALGNIIATLKPKASRSGKKKTSRAKKPTRIMLAAHMDQIGFLVSFIDDKGYLRVSPVGGFDTRNLFARLVTVIPDVRDPKQDLLGVMNPGGKPVHIASPEERTKVPKINEFVIDLGLPAEEVKEKVKIGDVVTLKAPFEKVGQAVTSQCMDNRIACWVAIEAMRKLKKAGGSAAEVVCVFTVQEEVGLRGAMISGFKVQPDIGIAIDTTLCVDTPGVGPDQRTTEFGGGAGLTVKDSSAITDLGLLEDFEQVAIKKKIKHQRSILGAGGTDAGAMQRAGAGCRTFTLSCPTRYIHTVTETVHVDDMNACRDLLAAYLAQAK